MTAMYKQTDPDSFCESILEQVISAHNLKVVVVSDFRRLNEYEFYKKHFRCIINVNIQADDSVKRDRGWKFDPRLD